MWQPFFSSNFFVSFLFFSLFRIFLFFLLNFLPFLIFRFLFYQLFCFFSSHFFRFWFFLFCKFFLPFFNFSLFRLFVFSLFCIFSLYQFFVFCLFICWFGSSYQLPSNPNLGWKLLQLNIKIKLCCDPSEAKSCYIYILVTDNPKIRDALTHKMKKTISEKNDDFHKFTIFL